MPLARLPRVDVVDIYKNDIWSTWRGLAFWRWMEWKSEIRNQCRVYMALFPAILRVFSRHIFSRRPRRIFFPAISYRAGHAVSFFPPYLFSPKRREQRIFAQRKPTDHLLPRTAWLHAAPALPITDTPY